MTYFCRIAFVHFKPHQAMARTGADPCCLLAVNPPVVWKEGRQHDDTCMYQCGRFADHCRGDSEKAARIGASSGHSLVWFGVPLWTNAILRKWIIETGTNPRILVEFWN